MALITSASKLFRGTTAIARVYRGASLILDLLGFENLAGRVSTGTAQLSIGPVTGTDPAGMAFVGYFTAPAAGFGATTVPWFTSADGSHQAYVSITAAGEAFASIYTRVGGTLQAAQTIYFQGDPIQPGERFVLVGSGIAGGSFALRQSRAGADFVDAGSVTIPAGAMFPIYGQGHTFFDNPIISEGVLVFAFGALPGVLGSLEALNAGKASIVGAGGARPTIDTIEAALGTPVYAVYGPAATITSNRGTAGGTYTLTGTITDYVPPALPAYVPELVYSENKFLTTTLPTGIDTGNPALVMVASYSHADTTITSGDQVFRMDGSIDFGFRPLNDGKLRAGVKYFDGGTSTFATVNSTAVFATTGTAQSLVMVASPGDVMDFFRYDRATEALVKIGNTAAIPATAEIRLNSIAAQIFTNLHNFNINEIAVYKLPTRPTDIIANTDKFFDANGLNVRPETTDNYLGAEAVIRKSGDAASWAAGTDEGTAGVTWTVNDGTPGVPFAALDPAASWPGYVAPVTGGEIPANSELLSRLSIQPHHTGDLLEGQGAEYRVEGSTELEWMGWAFYWNMDDEAETGFNPEMANMPGLYKNPAMRNYPVGPTSVYAYRTPGLRTIKVNVVPPVWSGIEGCQLEYTVDVKPLSFRYTSANTWVVVPAGVTDPTEIAGTRTTTFSAAWNAAKGTTTGTALIYLPGGETLPMLAGDPNYSYAKDNAHLYVRSYGTGKATIDASAKAFVLGGGSNVNPLSATMRDVLIDGGWDAATADGAVFISWKDEKSRTWTSFTDCRIQNSRWGMDFSGPTPDQTRASLMVVDTQFYNVLDYGAYVGNIERIGFAGCSAYWEEDMPMTKDGKSITGTNDYATHGMLRVQDLKYLTVYGCVGAIYHGWSKLDYVNTTLNAENTGKAPQPLVRIGATTVKAGARVHISRNYAEGNLCSIDAGATDGVEGPICVAGNGNYTLTGAANVSGLSVGHSGLTWSNAFTVMPNVPREANKPYTAYSAGNMTESEAGEGLRDKAFTFSRCATIFGFSDANAPAVSLDDLTGASVSDPDLLTQVPVNVDAPMVHAPNRTISGLPQGAITTTPWGPQPRKIGQFVELSNETIFSDLQYATPANSAVIAEFDSNLTVAPTAQTTAWDFWGNLRPATPTRGPIEKAPLTGTFGPWVAPDKSASNEAVV